MLNTHGLLQPDSFADVIATVVVFAASRWHHNSSFYDAYWSVLPPYLAVYWVIASGGDIREQFTHCIDIAPTVLEAAGIPEPTSVDGIPQEPMDGTSFVHTFADPGGEERHTVQYFESFGNRAIYKDGWWACARRT